MYTCKYISICIYKCIVLDCKLLTVDQVVLKLPTKSSGGYLNVKCLCASPG